MILLCLGALVPALLLCALKLSLVERSWQIVPCALLVATAPLFLHQFATRFSLLRVGQMFSTSGSMETFAVLLAVEAIVGLSLIAAVMSTLASAAMPTAIAAVERHSLGRGILSFAVVITLIAGGILDSPVFLVAGSVLLAGVLIWPWMPGRVRMSVLPRADKATLSRMSTFLLTPLWVLCSPAVLASILGMHMYLLRASTGKELHLLTSIYAGVLFGGLCLLTVALRVVVISWKKRLEGVILITFFMLVAAMFMPLLLSTVLPPASAVRVNWYATLALTGLAGLVIAVGALRTRRPSARSSFRV